MNRIFRHKYTIFSLMAAMAMLMVSATACIMDNEEPAAPDDGLMMVSFRVVTPNQTAASSRGVIPPDKNNTTGWGEDYDSEAGSDFDNLLLRDKFKVIITNNDCTNQVAIIQNIYCVTTTTQDGASKTYDFLGIISDEKFDDVQKLADGKLHVIANVEADLNNDATFSRHIGQAGDGDFDAIPMWGVQTVDFSEMKKGERFTVPDPVWLLRAMAKVEIELSDDSNNIIKALTDASLSGVNSSGYLLPTGWATTAQTKDLTYADSYRPNPSTIETPLIAKPQEGKIVFYLPECENPTDDNELRIAVKYSTDDKTDNTGYLRFIKYDNGKPIENDNPYNIVRNHLYRYTITGIKTVEDVQLSINYVVCPFDGNYTIDVPGFD